MATENASPILPLQYQSYDIPFAKWVSLLTLALAPLFAHIIAGAPRAFYLCKRQPKWHERLVHYNPTSVLWRYAAIADRRIRARHWSRADVAAANAIFWTAGGWDGSESMVERSQLHCTHLPASTRVALLSSDMLKTAVVTLQGVQTFVMLIRGLGGDDPADSFVLNMAVDFVFSPLAFIGLLRLASALWLTDDFNYTLRHAAELPQYPAPSEAMRRSSFDSFLEPPTEPELLGGRYGSTSRWSSRAFRALYLVPLLAMLAICAQLIARVFWVDHRYYASVSSSTFLVGICYIVFLTATSVICALYFIKGSTSTVLPCITTTWYKAYTLAVMAMALGSFVVSCLETRETPCGRFTSFPGSAGDFAACYSSTVHTVTSLNKGSEGSGPFAIATNYTQPSLRNETLQPGQFWLYNFTGTCLGITHSPEVGIAKILGNATFA